MSEPTQINLFEIIKPIFHNLNYLKVHLNELKTRHNALQRSLAGITNMETIISHVTDLLNEFKDNKCFSDLYASAKVIADYAIERSKQTDRDADKTIIAEMDAMIQQVREIQFMIVGMRSFLETEAEGQLEEMVNKFLERIPDLGENSIFTFVNNISRASNADFKK